MRTELLKEILGVPTFSGQEGGLSCYLSCYAAVEGYDYEVDKLGSVFITKGKPKPGEFYPLVCAHIDSVHPLLPTEIVEKDGILFAVDPKTGKKMGCGGDDKAGVFICLELLASLPCLKAALFVGEEVYCRGSQAAAPEFFEDVGYCIEFDSPQNDILSYSSDGTQLFEEHGEFAKTIVPILDSRAINKWQQHPYTDVAILKRRFDFTCINLPAGYYHMHSAHEYVNVKDVNNSCVAGHMAINELGCKKYPFVPSLYIMETNRKTTGLVLDRYGKKS